MQSNRIVVVLAADGVSGLDISYGKNINTMYLNSHLNNEFVVRPNFLLGASETMWVTFTKGDVSTKPLMLVQRKTTVENSTRQVVDGTESTIEQTPDTGYEYYLTMPDVVLQNVGQWSFSLTISELPVDVTYKGTVATVAALPAGGTLGDTYWVSGTSQYEYWNGSAWAVLNIVAISTSDVGTITVNASVAGDIGGTATDLDIQVLYSFVVGVLNNLSDYLPKIVNGYWYVWNSDTKGFVNSGEAASSLMYLKTLSDIKPPQVGDGITTRPANFNRVPIIGETFTVVFSSRGNTYICLMKYTDEGQNLSRYLYVGNTRGAQGEQGIQGEQGEKGDTGVGIASVTQQVVSGGTQITITLTDGTSTSFIVSNGDVSNVQSLEFPYGDPVVTYDTTDGLHIHADLRVVVNGVTNDIPLDLEIPQVADDGLTQDATADGKKAVIKADETVVRTNKTNQIINGNVTIGGNVTVNGTVTSVSAQNLKVKNKLIVVAEGNTVTLTSPAGLLAPKYDGTNNGALVFDGTGTAYVGDVVLTADGDIDVAKSDLQPLATRGTLVNGNIVKWNGDKLRLEDTGIAAGDVAKKSDLSKVGNFIYKSNYESATVPTVGQALTLTNANFSRTPVVGDVFQLMEVVNTKDTYANNMEILTVGDTTCTAKIMSFTDITSGKLDKTVGETLLPQAYVKNDDGTQGMADYIPGVFYFNYSGVLNLDNFDDVTITEGWNSNLVGMYYSISPCILSIGQLTGGVLGDTYIWGVNLSSVRTDDRSSVYFQGIAYKATETGYEYYNVLVQVDVTGMILYAAAQKIENAGNKVTAITGTGNDTNYPTTKAVADYVTSKEPYHFTYEWGTVLTAEQKAGIQNDPNCYFFVTQSDGVTYHYRRAAVEGNRYYFMAMHAYTTSEVIDVGQVFVEITTGDDRIISESIYAENLKNKTDVLNAQSTNNQYPTAKAVVDYTTTAIANAITTTLNTPV